MSTFGEDLIQSLEEALAHAKGEGSATIHAVLSPREVREQIKLTQAQMAPLMGMSVSGYRKWEQGRRQVSGPAAMLLQVIAREPEAVKRALRGVLPADQSKPWMRYAGMVESGDPQSSARVGDLVQDGVGDLTGCDL